MYKIGIAGASGKMGRRIASLIMLDPEANVAAALEREGIPEIGKDLGIVLGVSPAKIIIVSDLTQVCAEIECLIDFTLPEPTLEHVEACRKNGVAMVIGTTGFTAEQEAKIKEAADTIPIVFSPNMAVGVNLLFNIVAEAARVLGEDFEVKIDETHHVHKKDSPSGTAKMIAKVIEGASGVKPPIKAFREGEVIGNHGIVFEGEYETFEIRHDAKNRDVFADGAIKAAKFLNGKKSGLYSMNDVLGLSS